MKGFDRQNGAGTRKLHQAKSGLVVARQLHCYYQKYKTKAKTKTKQPKSPLMKNDQLNKLWQVQMIQNYPSVKQNELFMCTEMEGFPQ